MMNEELPCGVSVSVDAGEEFLQQTQNDREAQGRIIQNLKFKINEDRCSCSDDIGLL